MIASPEKPAIPAYEQIDDTRCPEVAPVTSGVKGMPAKYIFAVLAAGFLLAAVLGGLRGERHPATRTWLLIGTIFAAVSLWLFSRS
jgi:hypothetical protein